jgi:hypothetical protein
LPSWNHCKIKAKIIYSLINKFLKNKDEVMRNLKLYYKDAKTVKISTETSNEKEIERKCDDYDDEGDATEIERIISNYDDDHDDKEPTNNCIMDSGMSDHISTVIAKLNEFIKTNSISKEFYSKNYLNADMETLDIILMKKSSHEHFKYLYKIEDFLNNKGMMANLIKENNLLIKKKSENQINVENKNSLNTKSGIISNKKDNEIPQVENQNKRLLRNRIKTLREDQKNTVTIKFDNNLPYDTTNVKIESIKLISLIKFKIIFSLSITIIGKIMPQDITRQLKKILVEEKISKTEFGHSILKSYQFILPSVLNESKPWLHLDDRAKTCLKLIFLWLQGI